MSDSSDLLPDYKDTNYQRRRGNTDNIYSTDKISAGSHKATSYHLCLTELVLELVDLLKLLTAPLLVLFHLNFYLLQLLLILHELLPGLQKISCGAAVACVPQRLASLKLQIFPQHTLISNELNRIAYMTVV